ncbi:uncharacterized protein B0T15DRAFT_404242 [Chaetomium strumarium]|uniref:Ubiquitin carboxyl-terminal hydrolase 19 n=1 Tax=Chaetomium strumarium TaxID=1170767 RepID=A0AAJ0GLJ6_9PEZI|nr:hypothetical protein B0T15DRAFT_404242 [Chaetomium strumarium]
MDPIFAVSREEFYDVQMELRRIQHVQHLHGERLRSLEKRQADDAALRSVWNSPFPSALGGTPQHGPVVSGELISDFEDEAQNLLGSLQLETEDEPIRRGAASRANSVRFDESALHGANNSGHGGRQSGDFGIIRPGSGMGGHQMMERSYSHRSDGRHSSAGHSVHSMHSGISGRTSSLGLDTNFAIGGDEDESGLEMPERPPMLYILGSPPSIIRCWLTPTFTSDGLLYAVVCTGSQKSTVDYTLLKELDLVNNIHRDIDGAHRITLPVFLAEARVTQANSRAASPGPHLPNITASFEVTGMAQPESPESKKAIRVFIGSHTLRMHGADILLSRNLMTLYGSDRDKLAIPFVRPEDDAVFKHITTANVVPSKHKLNAAAPEFVASDKSAKGSVQDAKDQGSSRSMSMDSNSEAAVSPRAPSAQPAKQSITGATPESAGESAKQSAESAAPQLNGKEGTGATEANRRDPGAAIQTPWRQRATAGLGDSSTPLSGYQPAARPRSMKVLKPNRSSSSSMKTSATYEPAPTSRSSTEQRRNGGTTAISWGGSKRSLSGSAASSFGEAKSPSGQETGKGPSAARTANNPLGSASAFSWIAKPSPPTTATD